MSNNAHDKAALEEHFADIFALLREQDIEQFYAHYQLWVLRRRLPLLEKQLETLREHLADHQRTTEALRPSALALAVLVRLQSNGVSDTDVLDLMLNRGEDWLDRMMQRLDYCEQVEDFIQGDYTQWCVKSLEGAYDWIDSLLGSIKEETTPQEKSGNGIIATEELLLQKLSLDDEEAMLEVTFAQPAAKESSEPAIVSSTPSTASEQISPAGESLPELQPDTLLDQLPEPPGWKDLEDLEAPATDPAPWYSVNVTENGASLSDSAEQAVSMNDWIQVLHADNVTRTETDEIVSAAEPFTSTDRPEAGEIDASATSSDGTEVETHTEITDLASNPEAEAPESPAEIQSEQETLVPVDTEITQSWETALPDEIASAEAAAEIAEEENEQVADESSVVDEGTDTAEAQIPAEEATLTKEEQKETSAAQTQADEVLPSAGESEETAQDAHDHAPESEQAQAGNEIETAAVLNDILSIEGEPEGQGEHMAWYEFLELGETASDLASTETEEQSEPEEIESVAPPDPQASEISSVSEIYEYTAAEESAPTQSTTQQAAEETGEIEGWQTWQSDEGNEETLPFALKDLQSVRQAQSDSAQETEANAAQDEIEKGEIIDHAEEESATSDTEEADASAVSDEINVETDTSIVIVDGEANVASEEVIAETDLSVTADNVANADADTNDASVVTEAEDNPETPGNIQDGPVDLQSIGELNVYATFAEAEANAQTEEPLAGWSEPTSTSFFLPELTAEPAPFVQAEEAEIVSAESSSVQEDQQRARDEVSKIETVVEQVAVRLQVEETPQAQPVVTGEKPPKKPGFWRRLFSFGKKHEG